MSDLEFVLPRVPGYGGYTDEQTRNDTDQRVRAFVGERLQKLRDRLAPQLGGPEADAFESALLRCQFGDQAFIKSLEHARFDAAREAELVAHDRALLELAERLDAATSEQIGALLTALEEAFDQRRIPQAA